MTFSASHYFSESEIARAAELTREQSAGHKALIHVTTGHRQLAGRQFVIQQIAYWFTVLGIVVSELSTPLVAKPTFYWWMAMSLLTWLLRIALAVPVFFLSPDKVAASIPLKLCPIAIIMIANLFWIWTISIFVGPTLTAREMFMCIGFLSITISMTGMWPVTPIAVVIYIFTLWFGISTAMYINHTLPLSVIAALLGSVFIILGFNTFVAINQVKVQLNRSDEVDLLNAKLRAANETSERLREYANNKLEVRSAFFSEASHDFKQRLHGAKLMILAARMELGDDSSAVMSIERLGAEVDALEGYMTKLLDFARIETGDASVNLAPVRIQAVFQRLDVQFEEIARERDVSLKFWPTDIRIETDASMLHRILENLISNAMKFTRGKVLVAARRVDGAAVVEIYDQGVGIAPDSHARIFEAFHQESSKLRAQGVGLGLAIVKRFTDRLGYSVGLRSQLGRGSRFRVVIPREHTLPPMA